MYSTSKKVRLKPENLVLWGTKVETTASSKDDVQPATNKKKSRKERKEAAAKKAQARNNTSSQSKVAEQPEEEPVPDQAASPSTIDQCKRLPKKLEEESLNQQATEATKCVRHKVKCPMDKRPGDLLEFANPHIPGRNQSDSTNSSRCQDRKVLQSHGAATRRENDGSQVLRLYQRIPQRY
jgi:hypothetical protein